MHPLLFLSLTTLGVWRKRYYKKDIPSSPKAENAPKSHSLTRQPILDVLSSFEIANRKRERVGAASKEGGEIMTIDTRIISKP